MKAYQVEATGTLSSTFTDMEVMTKDTRTNYLVVALVRELTVAGLILAVLLFCKSNVVHSSPRLRESLPSIREFFPTFEPRTALFRPSPAATKLDCSIAALDKAKIILRNTFVGELALIATYQQIHE